MLNDVRIENILFLDIETVRAYPDFPLVPEKCRNFGRRNSND